eukprot:CAMPEP_0180247230 /NCGR_PEP_ID=MMETSP0987-20121128/36020_1 /TAXON_ID=697907 /ORGANISM="non described non described, Strain CCMP2293" /LENGTH=41 /DNA_ID= /DNA_START= /DNA_END= /DNA_ORIENTATION=
MATFCPPFPRSTSTATTCPLAAAFKGPSLPSPPSPRALASP